ncbi:Ferritin-like metal-binding protein YciE [Natronorubrum sediminis]|uniref:Ferritin-like metal-binding protein YciE n=1 Tax=Natronorubrum sediminis TaxID=640943 RepID=A0A1H6FUJ6_9EURY|nr:Ferritin-like metal-binding protein YciE [Natronorubrum sediminis]
MRTSVDQISDLEQLFHHKFAQQHTTEQELVEIFDEMATNATNDRLSKGVADHRDEIRMQVTRLEDVFAALDRPAEQREAPILDGLEQDRRMLEDAIEDDDLRNTISLNAAMMTEGIEMSAYEGLSTMATQIGYDDEIRKPLESNFDEGNPRIANCRRWNPQLS